jgi:hypothetical protein
MWFPFGFPGSKRCAGKGRTRLPPATIQSFRERSFTNGVAMNRSASRATVVLVLLIALFGVAGCIQKAKPASPAGFIPEKELEKPSDLPFQKAWRKKDLDWRHYTEIYVAPWNTEYHVTRKLCEIGLYAMPPAY